MNNKLKLFILIILPLFFLPMINGEIESLGIFQQHSCIELLQSCSNCTYINISSVIYPNSSQALGQVAMTKIGTKYNYTSCEVSSETGTYIVNGFGDVDGIITVFAYDYEVTPTGKIQSSILENPVLLILGIIGLCLIIFGATKGIPWFGFIGSIMFLLVGIYTMIYGFNNTTDLYTRGVALVFIGVGIIFMFLSAYEWWESAEEGGDY